MELYTDNSGVLYEVEYKNSAILSVNKVKRMAFSGIRRESIINEHIFEQEISEGMYQKVKNPPEIKEPVTLKYIEHRIDNTQQVNSLFSSYRCYIPELHVYVAVTSEMPLYFYPNKFYPNNYYSFYGHVEWIDVTRQPGYKKNVCIYKTLPKSEMLKVIIE